MLLVPAKRLNMMQFPVKKITLLGLFICIGLLLGYLESFIVFPIAIPGIKIGLSNVITVLSLYLFGPAFALTVLICRVLLSGLLFGSGISLLYSLSGAIVSYLGMILFKKLPYFSIYGISILGGVLHNLAQLFVAGLAVKIPYLLYYLPALLISGVLAGLIVGIISNILVKRLTPIINKTFKGD